MTPYSAIMCIPMKKMELDHHIGPRSVDVLRDGVTLTSEAEAEASSREDGNDRVVGSRATRLAAGITETSIGAVEGLLEW